MRHRWNKNIKWEGQMPESVYKIDQCATCGLYRMHKQTHKMFTKTYLKSGCETDNLPECKDTNLFSEASGN